MALNPDQIPERLRGYLLPGEEVLWIGKPAIRQVIWKSLLMPSVVTLIFVLVDLNGRRPHRGSFWIPFAMAMAAIVTGKLCFDLVRGRNTLQAFTNMRVLLPSGWDRSGIIPVNYQEIREIKERDGNGWIKQGVAIWTHGNDLRRMFPLLMVPGHDEYETVFRVLRRTWLIANGELPPSAMEWEPRL